MALAVTGPATFYGGINAGGNPITNVGVPINPTDAATKGYVDTGLGALTNTMNDKFSHANGGIAAAMSMASPDRTGGQTGAIAFSEAWWGGHSATGITAIQRVYDAGSWDFSVGGGVSVADTGDYGGRVTGQIGWGGGYVPLK